MNSQVSEAWVVNANRVIADIRDLCEAARDGRPVPEWLQERLEEIEDALESL